MLRLRNIFFGIIGLLVFTNNCVLTRGVIEKAHPVPEYEIWNQEKMTGIKKNQDSIWIESVYMNDKQERKFFYIRVSEQRIQDFYPANHIVDKNDVKSTCQKCEDINYSIHSFEKTEILYPGSNKILDFRNYYPGKEMDTRNFHKSIKGLISAKLNRERKELYLIFDNQNSEYYYVHHKPHEVRFYLVKNFSSEYIEKNLNTVPMKDFSFQNGFFIEDENRKVHWISLETNKLQTKERNLKTNDFAVGKQLNRSPRLEIYPIIPIAVAADIVLLPVYIPLFLYAYIGFRRTALG